jgi:hypothetical protein
MTVVPEKDQNGVTLLDGDALITVNDAASLGDTTIQTNNTSILAGGVDDVSGTAGLSSNNAAASNGSVENVVGIQPVDSVENVSTGQAMTAGGAADGVPSSTFALSGTKIFPSADFPTGSTPTDISSVDWHFPTGDPSNYNGNQVRPTMPQASGVTESGVLTGVMHLPLNTYNPSAPGASFYNSEAVSNQTFGPPTGNHGLAFTAQVFYSSDSVQQGLIGGFFLLWVDPDNSKVHDELDFEAFTNFPNQIQTNAYHNEPFYTGHPIKYALSGPTPAVAQVHTYEIDWFQHEVDWKVDGKTVRTITDTDKDPANPEKILDLVPDHPMDLHFNIWDAPSAWGFEAGGATDPSSPLYKPADTGPGSQYTFNVQNVQVETITLPLKGGPGANVEFFSGAAGQFEISATAGEQFVLVTDKSGAQGTRTVLGSETLQFNDRTVDASVIVKAANLGAQHFFPLIDLYDAYLHRAPDALGLDYWASALSNGMSLVDIAKSFDASAEGVANQHQGQSLSDIVTSAYTDILHRAPDAGGLNYWVQQLQSGLPLELFPLSFIMGARGADSHEVATQETIGAQFAIEQGLTDVAQAKAVFAPFATPGVAAINAANALIHSYAAAAALPDSSELVVKLLGIIIMSDTL